MRSWEFFTKNIDPKILTQLKKCNSFGYNLKIIGVSGTVGKTTVAELIAGYLNFIGKRTFYIGTSGLHCKAANYIQMNFPSTSPTSVKMLKTFIHGAYFYHCEYLVIEVTAETISTGIYDNLDFDIYCFTNLKRDFVRSFKNDEIYFQNKLSIFKRAKVYKVISSFKNSELNFLLKGLGVNLKLFKQRHSVDHKTCKLTMYLDDVEYKTNLLSSINAENAACFYTAIKELGLLNIPLLKQYFNSVLIPGRLESLNIAGRQIVIDTGYGGVEGFSPFFKEIKNTNIIVVISSYYFDNNNDFSENIKEKRKQKAKFIYDHSKKMILTATHRRVKNLSTTKEQCVLDQLQKGAPNAIQIYNRMEAIKWAVDNSKPNDIIVLIGTGSETWGKIGNKNTTFIGDADYINLLLTNNSEIYTDQVKVDSQDGSEIIIQTPWLQSSLIYYLPNQLKSAASNCWKQVYKSPIKLNIK